MQLVSFGLIFLPSTRRMFQHLCLKKQKEGILTKPEYDWLR